MSTEVVENKGESPLIDISPSQESTMEDVYSLRASLQISNLTEQEIKYKVTKIQPENKDEQPQESSLEAKESKTIKIDLDHKGTKVEDTKLLIEAFDPSESDHVTKVNVEV
mmetsp:Transcript_28859/g.26175  ORF Transcript_28859/g.26175 Transcript_28859/m.26175 type:complete len:111 (+) Transcript_28859:123-455(+)